MSIFLTSRTLSTSDDTETRIAKSIFNGCTVIRRAPRIRDLDHAVSQDDLRCGDAELDAHAMHNPADVVRPAFFAYIYDEHME